MTTATFDSIAVRSIARHARELTEALARCKSCPACGKEGWHDDDCSAMWLASWVDSLERESGESFGLRDVEQWLDADGEAGLPDHLRTPFEQIDPVGADA